MPAWEQIVIVSVALGIGFLVGWLLAERRAAARAAMAEREARAQAEALRADLATRQAELAGARADVLNGQRSLVDAKSAQEESLKELRSTFEALSAKALRDMQPDFLRLATESFGKLHESAKGDLATREKSIEGLVKPLEEHLKTYQTRLQQAESKQAETLGEVKKQIDQLALNSTTLSNETFKLRNVLSSSVARGRWGEETLRNVVEAAGLSPHCDFVEQAVADDSKPDMIVNLPGGRRIIVDSKVPELEFIEGLRSADDSARATAVAAHVAKLRLTIRTLSERHYPEKFPGSLDHVILFLPAESLFSAALEGDRELVVWASKQHNIVLATPASLIAVLRSVALNWQQHQVSENAQEISKAAQELYERVTMFVAHFGKLRDALSKASEAYNEAVGSYEKRVRPTGQKLELLGGASSVRDLPEILPLENTLRLPPSSTLVP